MSYEKTLLDYESYLRGEEKSTATVQKYLRDVRGFVSFLDGRVLCKGETVAYKEHLVADYAPSSVNSMLNALNGFLHFLKKDECCVKLLKIQRQIFRSPEKELSLQEYQRLVKAAEGTRLSLVLQTICGTGIRVSELQYITVKAVREGKSVVNCKNKTRIIFIPLPLQKILRKYIKKNGLKSGPVFITKNGKPLNRSNIWRDMRRLCKSARVSPEKVYPHNLRRLFARTFYSVEKDIVRLADLLGHSSINTTRIYTMESGIQHRAWLEQVHRMLTT